MMVIIKNNIRYDPLLIFIKVVVFFVSFFFLLPLKMLVYAYSFFVSSICYFTFFCLSALAYFWQCWLPIFFFVGLLFYCYILFILFLASFFERFLFNWSKFPLLFVSIFHFYSYIVQIGSIVFLFCSYLGFYFICLFMISNIFCLSVVLFFCFVLSFTYLFLLLFWSFFSYLLLKKVFWNE